VRHPRQRRSPISTTPWSGPGIKERFSDYEPPDPAR
jgi:hypothetical protein